jgi:thioredoxin 1
VTVATPSDSEQLENIIQSGVTLLDFNSPWCSPCRAQEAVVETLAQKFHPTVKVITLNVDDNMQFAVGRKITSIPTLIIYKNGKELRRFIGLQSAEVLTQAIEAALG